LVPKPKYSLLAVRAYASLAEACDDVPRLLQLQPSAVELIPRLIFQLARSIPAYASRLGWLPGDPAAVLVVEFSGDRPDVLRAAASQIGEVLFVAESPAEQARIWEVRKVGLGLLDARPQSARPVAFIEDCAVPVERLGEFVREIEQILQAHGTEGGIYAHASAGCLHIRPILDLHTPHGVRSLRSIAEQTLALTLRLGGAMSSEHGDGLARGEWLLRTYGAEVMTAMRTLKQTADPHGLLNPGKWFDAPPMDTQLRYGVLAQAHPWQPTLDFSRNGGLQTAIEQCNGQGVCRKESGLMCPSFQATREEMHSTRGRANLLRALIFQPAPALSHNPALSESVAQALDLCLACKGCKAECPSGVDMAKLKFEFQYQYYRSHVRRLRDYFFGHFNLFAQTISPLGEVFNRLSRWHLLRRALHRWLGIAENRPLPQFRRLRLPSRRSLPGKSRERVLFLPDAFTHFFEPEIEQAALDLLAACDIEVIRLPLWGAGRSLISKGFLDAAKRHARRLIQVIERLDPAGELAIVGIEPSELNVLRDELADLLPEYSAATVSLSARAWSLEEYLIRPDERGEKRILRIARMRKQQKGENAPKVLLHGHCSQKAQPPAADGLPVGQEAAAEFLRAFGLDVEIIPSGCCGMAGAFGYESDHYELSLQIGELVLFPYLRQKLPARPEIAAPGTSCRAQIQDGVQAKAEHPLRIAWKHLKNSGMERL
ncbi:MAG: FAD-binding and (Fe-S)-binding domain-containing protein, partial [Anaerolineae bacterium]